MSGVVITPASFQQAYRAYATEQGNDPALGRIKAAEASEQTQTVASRVDLTADSVYISPEAAKLYAETLRKQKTVSRQSAPRSLHAAETATHEVTGVPNRHHNDESEQDPEERATDEDASL